MENLKKYPAFFGLLGLFLVIFIAGLVFIFLSLSAAGKAKEDFERAQRDLKSAATLSPAPSKENLAASEQNIRDLAAALERQIKATRGRAPELLDRQKAPTQPVTMLVQLENFASDFTKEAKTIAPQGSEDDETRAAEGIKLPENFKFGFGRYLDTGQQPDEKIIPELFKQKQILSFILRRLYDSQPFSIESIQRESLVEVVPEKGNQSNRQPQRNDSNSNKGEFKIGDITAAVPGAIETMAFRLEFTGYTPTLRQFLKKLEEFELPLVVRSVEVKPAKTSKPAASSKPASNNPFGFGSPVETQPAASTAKTLDPIVEENLSHFTVVVEYIQVLIKAPSDVAALESAGNSQSAQ